MHINLEDIAVMMDTDVKNIEHLFDDGMHIPDLDYQVLSGDKLQRCEKHIDDVIGGKELRVSSKESVEVWEKGWGEILGRVTENGLSEKELTPQYFNNNIFRLQGNYVEAQDCEFENRLYECVKRFLFDHYFRGVSKVVEFGCGTGASLLLLAEMYKNLDITGCDWASPSVELANTIGTTKKQSVKGHLFNMFDLTGQDSLHIDNGTGVFSFHALEQLGSDFSPFIDWLIGSRPKIAFHLEPIVEFYDSGSAFDRRAIEYHEKRNYLGGFFSYLKRKEEEGIIRIIKSKRLGFGGMFHEAYTLIVWEVV